MGFPADEARHVSDETFRHADETIFQSQRSPPGTNPGYQGASVRQRGSIMWASILNSIYREILRTSLSGMHKLAID
jgi:hypothetical protein